LRGTNFATGKVGTPLDFVSFHAKGVPVFVDGHVRMGLSNHLRTIADGFGIIRSYPELRGIPVVIGESDPDGCAACQGPQLGYRNTTLYSSYTAASFARIHELADEYGVNLEGALTWAFEFENQALFAGFRALASEGLDLPVLNVFRMFAKMGGTRLAVESGAAQPLAAVLKNGVRAEPEISAMASLDGSRLSVLVWHYHDDDIAGPAAGVSLTLAGLPPKSGLLKARIFRVDHDHANSFTAWQQMGAPLAPTPRQYALLRDAGRLTSEDLAEPLRVENSTVRIHLTLPRQAVWLIVFDPPSTSTL
jgi:xylan 1,4-beta-xylosidase